MTEESIEKKEAETERPRERPKWSVRRRIVVGICLAIGIYFFSYGPMVLSAVNHYGRYQGNKMAFLKAFYAPATALADHTETYAAYRDFWVRRSRNYEWYLEKVREHEREAKKKALKEVLSASDR